MISLFFAKFSASGHPQKKTNHCQKPTRRGQDFFLFQLWFRFFLFRSTNFSINWHLHHNSLSNPNSHFTPKPNPFITNLQNQTNLKKINPISLPPSPYQQLHIINPLRLIVIKEKTHHNSLSERQLTSPSQHHVQTHQKIPQQTQPKPSKIYAQVKKTLHPKKNSYSISPVRTHPQTFSSIQTLKQTHTHSLAHR